MTYEWQRKQELQDELLGSATCSWTILQTLTRLISWTEVWPREALQFTGKTTDTAGDSLQHVRDQITKIAKFLTVEWRPCHDSRG
jgi:hypothetical protein